MSAVGLARIGASDDDLGGRLFRHGIEQLVLHFGEEHLSRRVVGAVVTGQGEQFAHLLVKTLLGSANFADARQQLVEVVPALRILQALVVHDEALDEVFAKVGGCPLAELCAARTLDPIADGQDHFQSVELGSIALVVRGSY